MKFLEAPCKCYTPPLDYRDYVITEVGTDFSKNLYGEVTSEVCKHCGTIWIKYLFECEGFTESGRWYRAVITKKNLRGFTPEQAIDHISNVGWHLYGGSYFRSSGKVGSGRISPSLYS